MARIIVIAVLVIAVAIVGWTIGSAIARPSHRVPRDKSAACASDAADSLRLGIDCVGVSVNFFCHDGNNNLLMGKRTNACRDEHGRWDAGGGGVDFGLGVEETLRKEILEEYGAAVLSHDFLGYRDVHRIHLDTRTHWIALDFKVLLNPQEVVNREPHKCSELKFFSFNELPSPTHSQFPRAWSMYRDRM